MKNHTDLNLQTICTFILFHFPDTRIISHDREITHETHMRPYYSKMGTFLPWP